AKPRFGYYEDEDSSYEDEDEQQSVDLLEPFTGYLEAVGSVGCPCSSLQQVLVAFGVMPPVLAGKKLRRLFAACAFVLLPCTQPSCFILN
ncbi:unnamed protein product, partial [Anisakis simplex]|uniref:DEAD/DEAH box RNA helicase family protein n=1 Tax=Anisakis simplex TaxID=6269 RepID=A0A0M3JT83_ANISI